MSRLRYLSRQISRTRQDAANEGRYVRSAAYTFASLSFVGVAWKAGDTMSHDDNFTKPTAGSQTSTLTLLRSYIVWTVLGLPHIVDASPKILDFLLNSRLPLVSPAAESIIRSTFYAQFIPGDTAEDCIATLESLRRKNIGSALNYSAEADVVDQDAVVDIQTRRFQEIERAIDVQGSFEQGMQLEGWSAGSSAFAVKVSGLIDHDVLRRASTALTAKRDAVPTRIGSDVPAPGFPSIGDGEILISVESDSAIDMSTKGGNEVQPPPSLIAGDLEQLQILWNRLDSLAARARDKGVKLILDAEETWLNPAIDGYTFLLSMKHNRPSNQKGYREELTSEVPVVYGSYQSYLMRQPAYLKAAIEHANLNGYALGLKLVRGGYISKEKAAAEAKGQSGNGAVWESVETILDTLRTQLDSDESLPLGVIFGTHNTDSVTHIINTLESKGLATRTAAGSLRLRPDVHGRVNVAQLYGMREDLSDIIRTTFEPSKAAISLCFIAYGSLRETLPFLSRRAVENKSVMSGSSGAAAERRRVGVLLRQRWSLGLW